MIKVTILLPVLNQIKFIEERIKTIVGQSYVDWECVVIDGFSSDGTWEFIKDQALDDERFQLYQYPAKGIYNAWNKGIAKAKGEYIYIATADDTMEKQCIEKLADALDTHQECGLSTCKLKIIDEFGNQHKDNNWDDYPLVHYFGNLIDKEHVRMAPHDGLLHAVARSVYTSITQIMIRKKVFDRIGFFREDIGSIADYEWNMATTLIFNTVFVPEYLATWRVHGNQATDDAIQSTPEYFKSLICIIEMAYKRALEREKKIIKYNLKKIRRPMVEQFLNAVIKKKRNVFYKIYAFLFIVYKNYHVFFIRKNENSPLFYKCFLEQFDVSSNLKKIDSTKHL